MTVPAPLDPDRIPTHVAIVMDGNGRWAKLRKKPRLYGHKVGADSVREIVAFLEEANRHAPLEVCIFNVGANVRFPLVETLRLGWPLRIGLGGVGGVFFFDVGGAFSDDARPVRHGELDDLAAEIDSIVSILDDSIQAAMAQI